jgi:serine protease AprX
MYSISRKAAFGALMLVAAVGIHAASGRASTTAAKVPATLLAQAQANPSKMFHLVIEGRSSTQETLSRVQALLTRLPASDTALERRLAVIKGVSARLTGAELVALADDAGIAAITPDAAVRLDSYSSRQQWPYVSGVARSWAGVANGSLTMPAIAVVDSGIQADRPDFAGRVREQVNLTTLDGNSAGDGRGHGTFVAGIAAGGAANYTGAAPGAPIVSIDVMDDRGVAKTSDVVAAADWILQNKDRLGIRVANFSLHSSMYTSAFASPLNHAIECLWFAGIVVVAASGNYGSGGQTSMGYAPGNDPFVITVGADDVSGSVSSNDDFAAPWSAYGYTLDGFAKPELGAPGRYMVGPTPGSSTLWQEHPDRVVAPGYMQLSGTSFAAPVVAGAAAYVLALHSGWTPDQVKGALMATVRSAPTAAARSLGLGVVNAARAVDVTAPANPNLALYRFVVPDPAGGSLPVFDAAGWRSAARADSGWDAPSWSSANWSDAGWSDASWSAANWSDSSGADASWSDVSGSDANWADDAADDYLSAGGYWISDAELAAALAEYGTP